LAQVIFGLKLHHQSTPASLANMMAYNPANMSTVAGGIQYASAPAYGGQVIETVAAPQVNYAPQMYAAAPTTTYAAATTMAAPMAYAAAAPVVEYAQPSYAPMAIPTQTMPAPMAYTTQAPSYVAAPQYAMPQTMMQPQAPSYVAAPQRQPLQQIAAPQVAMPQMIQAPAAPVAPMKLTEGIPTPEQIAQQKAGYSAALDKQLREAIDTVQKETVIEKEMIRFTAEKNIALHNMQVDEKLTEAHALADEQATFAFLELNKAKVERSLQLSNQANGLVMDYQMKAIQTELAQKQYAFQQQYAQAEGALEQQYMQQVAQANTGTTYAVPAQAIAAPAVAAAASKK